MRMTIKIDMDNAAFADCNNGQESARILSKLARGIESAHLIKHDHGQLLDVNGNVVGTWKVTR